MGIICDLVIAEDGAAQAIVTADNLWDTYRVYQTKLLDPVTLDGLFALLDPAPPDPGAWWDTPLVEHDEQEAIFQLPPAIVAQLAALTPGQRHDLAWRWWQHSEELAMAYKFTRLTPDEIAGQVLALVDGVCAFLREAVEGDQRVYLYLSA